jgi:hypothetical protein
MTVNTIRKKLMGYLADADQKKLKALYTLLEDDIQEAEKNVFTKEQLSLLNEEHALHISGKTKSYSWDEAKEIIRGKKAM